MVFTLGECKWGTDAVGRNVVKDLIEERAPRVLKRPTGEWRTHYAFFSRAGFTDAAKEEAAKVEARMVDLAQLDRELQ
jgi:hypothetical protein